jgi:GDP-L-fucose synthase
MKNDFSRGAKILIAGDGGLIEEGFYQFLVRGGFTAVLSASRIGLDAAIQPAVYDFFQKERPDYVVLGSTVSGGIGANRARPADFIYHNSESQNNVIYAGWKFGVKKLVYLGASCVYPKDAAPPIKEGALLTGELEPTSAPYSVAKIAGIKLCEAYRKQYGFEAVSVIPATVYGPQRDIDAGGSHVMGALVKNFYEAARQGRREVSVWGSGEARREFIYIDDLARAIMVILERPVAPEVVNVGTGRDISIRELAGIVAGAAGFKGEIRCDRSKPEGARQKLLDSGRARDLGWRPEVRLEDGIARCVGCLREDKR